MAAAFRLPVEAAVDCPPEAAVDCPPEAGAAPLTWVVEAAGRLTAEAERSAAGVPPLECSGRCPRESSPDRRSRT